MYVLTGALQRYDWGSTTAIHGFAQLGEAGEPLAEVWYGAHPSAPSTVERGVRLDQVIHDEAERILGAEVASRFDGRLPYLVKLIAPGRAVSVQVHPSAERAAAGYRAEQDARSRAAVSDAAKFVDPNHKPELIYALTPFDGLVGLRPVADAIRELDRFGLPVTERASRALRDGPREAVRTLANADAHDVAELVRRARVLEAEAEAEGRVGASGASGARPSAARTLLDLHEQYPGDPGVAVSIVLHRRLLQPGESVLVPSGVPHAYLSGLAVEVMANSDNVFRLGLTSKRIDVDEAVANLITDPAVVQRPHANGASGTAEFQVEVRPLAAGVPESVDGPGPRIVVVAGGRCAIRGTGRSVDLAQGQAVLVGHEEQGISVTGSGHVVIVSVPAAAAKAAG